MTAVFSDAVNPTSIEATGAGGGNGLVSNPPRPLYARRFAHFKQPRQNFRSTFGKIESGIGHFGNGGDQTSHLVRFQVSD